MCFLVWALKYCKVVSNGHRLGGPMKQIHNVKFTIGDVRYTSLKHMFVPWEGVNNPLYDEYNFKHSSTHFNVPMLFFRLCLIHFWILSLKDYGLGLQGMMPCHRCVLVVWSFQIHKKFENRDLKPTVRRVILFDWILYIFHAQDISLTSYNAFNGEYQADNLM